MDFRPWHLGPEAENMLTFDQNTDIRSLSAVTLAFLGDAVYELLVRERLACENAPPGKLHQKAVAQVCCAAQARAFDALFAVATEEEQAVLRRGRNANSAHVPKNAQVAEYRKATGVEALFGFLYLKKDLVRIQELFSFVQEQIAENARQEIPSK